SGNSASYPLDLIIYQDKLYFSAKGSSEEGYELWVYEGFDQPYLVVDLTPTGYISTNPTHLVVFNEQLFFRTGNSATGDVYAFDGIDFRQIEFYNNLGASTLNVVFGGELYFTASSSGLDITLWKLIAPGTTITYN
ncbi:MAG: hypothetical protein MKZ58_05300, partial [Candidatus Poseidoniaceae archaeon]|nr:hypothetical protein [Candidatus Poseidoniaceae archaeon]